MLEEFTLWVGSVLGLDREPGQLSTGQVCARTVVIFLVALMMLRLAPKRFLAQRNAWDVLLSLLIASTLARAINGSAPFFPTIVAGFLMVGMHRLVAAAAARSHAVSALVKGHTALVVDDGVVKDSVLRRHDVSRHDLDEDLRLNGIDRPEQVRQATIERNGQISVLKKADQS